MTKAEERRLFLQQQTQPTQGLTKADQRRMQLQGAIPIVQTPVTTPQPTVTQPAATTPTVQATTVQPTTQTMTEKLKSGARLTPAETIQLAAEMGKITPEEAKRQTELAEKPLDQAIANVNKEVERAVKDNNLLGDVNSGKYFEYQGKLEEAQQKGDIVKENAYKGLLDKMDEAYKPMTKDWYNLLKPDTEFLQGQINNRIYDVKWAENKLLEANTVEEQAKRAEEYKKEYDKYLKAVNEYQDALLYEKYNNNPIVDAADMLLYTGAESVANLIEGTAEDIKDNRENIRGVGYGNIDAQKLLDTNNERKKGGNTALRYAALNPSLNALQYQASKENAGEAIKTLYEQISNGTFAGTKADIEEILTNEKREQNTYSRKEEIQQSVQHKKNKFNWKYEPNEATQKVLNALEIVTRMLPNQAASLIAPGLGDIVMYETAGNQAQDKALAEGATYSQAGLNKALKGSAEAAFEHLVTSSIDKAVGRAGLIEPSKWAENISNPILRAGTNLTVNAIGEGLEEIPTAVLDPIIDRITHNPEAPLATAEDIWGAFAESILPTVIMTGAGGTLQAIDNYATNARNKVNNSYLSDLQKAELLNQIENGKKELIKQIEQREQEINQASTQQNTQQNNQNLTQYPSFDMRKDFNHEIRAKGTNEERAKYFGELWKANYATEGITREYAKKSSNGTITPEEQADYDRIVKANRERAEAMRLLSEAGMSEIDLDDLVDEMKQQTNLPQQANIVDIMKSEEYNTVGKTQYATIAPYRANNVTEANIDQSREAIEKQFVDNANGIANALGIQITNISNNMGGFMSQEGPYKGQAVNELSYTFELGNATPEQADMFARLVGDLGNEVQEAVIASNYVDFNDSAATALEIDIKVNDLENITDILKAAGIEDYTIDRTNNQIKLLVFGEKETDKLDNLIKGLGGNYGGFKETKVNSRYIGREDRQNAYGEWLRTSGEGEQNRQLRDYISKALKAVENDLQKDKQSIQENSNQSSFSFDLPDNISIKDSKGREIDHKIHTHSTSAYSDQVNMLKYFEDEDGNTIAKVDYSYYDGKIYVNMIETLPEYRRKGLATRLIKDLENDAKEEGMTIDYGYTTRDGTAFLEKTNQPKQPDNLLPSNKQLQQQETESIENEPIVQMPENKKTKKLEDIANSTPEDVRQRPMEYTQRKDKNTSNQRKFFDNAETSNIIADNTKNYITPTTYEQKKNLDTLEEVRQKLDERGNDMIEEWKHKMKNFTDKDVALGAILVERYQQDGDWKSAARTVEKLADMGTEAGRAVQMYSIFQRLSPETMAIYQQKALNSAFEEMKQRKTGKWVEANKDKFKLTPEETQFIYEQVEKASQAVDEETKQRELSKIERMINNKLPPDAGQAIRALRRIAMLFNPKTQVRNIVGNALIMPVNDVADFVGSVIDRLVSRKTGVRTTSTPNVITKAKGFGKGIKAAVTDYKTKTRTTASGNKYEFDIGAKPFNENTTSKVKNAINHKLNGINELLSAVMSGGDRPFYEAAYKNSLEGQMKANKVKEPTQDMIDIAVNEALQRTWNDDNNYTRTVLSIRKAMNNINIRGFGLGDLIIPFAKTPANLTKAMVEYSPAGFIGSVIDFNDMRKAISRGEMTPMQQKKFVASTSKAIAGSLLYLIAGSLVKAGKITGSADDDKDVKNFEQNVLGIQPYSVRIGDKTYTYSWANPINAPLAIMADTYKMTKENASNWDILNNAFKVAGETLVENSFLQGIKELFGKDSISEGIVDAVESFPESLVPTFLSQIASLNDTKQRQSFEYQNDLQTIANKIKNKIPGLRNTLSPQVNTFGEEIENQNNAFNAFISPANVREAKITDEQKALYDVYQETKDKTIFPMQAPYYTNTDNGEKQNLTSKDRTTYQKASGNFVDEAYDGLFDDEVFKDLKNEGKVKILHEIATDGNLKGREAVGAVKEATNSNLSKLNEKMEALDKADIPLADYYIAWYAKNNLAQGKTQDSQRKAIRDYTDLTPQQEEILYGIFNISKKGS